MRDRIHPTIAPTTTSPAEATTSHATSKKKATVPMANPTNMMMTAVQAAGEFPWPGSDSFIDLHS
jgi:hypothetical protein